MEGADGVEGDDIGEAEVGEATDVGVVVDGMGRQGEVVAVTVDEHVLAAGLVGEGTVGGRDSFHFPRSEEVGFNDARATNERYFHDRRGVTV